MSSKTDLEIIRGTTFPITFENTDSAGLPINLTGATVYFTAKLVDSDTDATDVTAAITKDVTTHVDETGAASATRGISTITLGAGQTTINTKTYFYDITVKYANGVINTPIEGKLKIVGKRTNRSL